MTKIYPMTAAVREAYKRGENDEALEPLVLVDKYNEPIGRFKNNDVVLFYDLRGEREIELTRSFTDREFKEFSIAESLKLHFVTMIEYDKSLNVDVAYPPEKPVKDTLSAVLSRKGIKYAKIAESEKAVHIGYFFNGKSKINLPCEEYVIIPSLKNVKSFDKYPEMRIKDVVTAIKRKLRENEKKLIIANFANVDVVGHTENEFAIKRAVEAVDSALGVVLKEAERRKVTVIVTSDHGTVENWLYPNGTIDSGHTANPVPFIAIEPDKNILSNINLRNNGRLYDVAPTILEILRLNKPKAMTGSSLFIGDPYKAVSRDNDKRVLMLILDGWGLSKRAKGNLIRSSYTPVMNYLTKKYPFTSLKAAGEYVGMPPGSVGNSEVGHLHLGTGRLVLSDRVKIDEEIRSGRFFKNAIFIKAMRRARRMQKALHLLGIVSFYSSHGSVEHLKALMKLARAERLKNVYIHAIVGRRGERHESGAHYIKDIEKTAAELGTGKLVSVIGRFWALDREEHWNRIEKTYRMLVYGDGKNVKC